MMMMESLLGSATTVGGAIANTSTQNPTNVVLVEEEPGQAEQQELAKKQLEGHQKQIITVLEMEKKQVVLSRIKKFQLHLFPSLK